MTGPKSVSIPSPREPLFGMLHPAECGSLAVVMCPPLAEEKKTSYRMFYEQAEAIAAKGISVLRFDYFGTGDSPGGFEENSLDTWSDDIRAASEFMLSETGAEKLCLIGLRLGGTLALTCRCDHLVLWQPIMDVRTYLKANAQRQHIRHKLIDGDSEGVPRMEIDGYPLSEGLIRSMEGIKPVIDHRHCLLVQISYTEKVSAEYLPYHEQSGVEFKALRMEPFWSRIGRVDTNPLINLTTDWIRGHL